MTQFFEKDGKMEPVTVIEAGPCFVTQVKEKEKDGYEAVQVGFQKIEKKKKIKKPQTEKPFRYLREFKNEIKDFREGQKIDASVFQ